MGYAHSEIRWSWTKLKCHIDTYVKTKKWSYTAVKCWIQCSIYSKHSTHFYAALLAEVAYISKSELQDVDDVDFFRTKMESIVQVKSNLSWIFPNAARLSQKRHPKSTQNSEKSSYYQCMRTEKLKRTFSFGHHSHQSSE